MSIAFVAVAYESPGEAEAFARRFSVTPEIDLVLVDNSVGKNAGELSRRLADSPPNVTVVDARVNAGYFGGARRGLLALPRELGAYDWIVVSNVDLELDPFAFARGLALHDPNGLGCVAPDVTDPSGQWHLNPFMIARPSRGRMRRLALVSRTYWIAAAYSLAAELARTFRVRSRASRVLESGGTMIYAPHGSIIPLSRAYFLRGGTLEHEPFLFGEEITIAERCLRMGLAVKFDPALKVVHTEHVSIGRVPGRTAHGWMKEATAHLYRAYFS